MWIRSQDRNTLRDVNELYINKSKNSCMVCSELDSIILGTYSTEEKALKVLDMIQKQIVFCSESYEIVRPILKSDPFEPYWRKREVVFNMPKDDEVDL